MRGPARGRACDSDETRRTGARDRRLGRRAPGDRGRVSGCDERSVRQRRLPHARAHGAGLVPLVVGPTGSVRGLVAAVVARGPCWPPPARVRRQRGGRGDRVVGWWRPWAREVRVGLRQRAFGVNEVAFHVASLVLVAGVVAALVTS